MQYAVTIELEESVYLPLMKNIGKENLGHFFSCLAQPYLMLQSEKPTIKPTKDSILGFTQGDMTILGDIVSPTTADSDWDVMRCDDNFGHPCLNLDDPITANFG